VATLLPANAELLKLGDLSRLLARSNVNEVRAFLTALTGKTGMRSSALVSLVASALATPGRTEWTQLVRDGLAFYAVAQVPAVAAAFGYIEIIPANAKYTLLLKSFRVSWSVATEFFVVLDGLAGAPTALAANGASNTAGGRGSLRLSAGLTGTMQSTVNYGSTAAAGLGGNGVTLRRVFCPPNESVELLTSEMVFGEELGTALVAPAIVANTLNQAFDAELLWAEVPADGSYP